MATPSVPSVGFVSWSLLGLLGAANPAYRGAKSHADGGDPSRVGTRFQQLRPPAGNRKPPNPRRSERQVYWPCLPWSVEIHFAVKVLMSPSPQ